MLKSARVSLVIEYLLGVSFLLIIIYFCISNVYYSIDENFVGPYWILSSNPKKQLRIIPIVKKPPILWVHTEDITFHIKKIIVQIRFSMAKI